MVAQNVYQQCHSEYNWTDCAHSLQDEIHLRDVVLDRANALRKLTLVHEPQEEYDLHRDYCDVVYSGVVLLGVHWECTCAGREVNLLQWKVNQAGEDAHYVIAPLLVKRLVPFKPSFLCSLVDHVHHNRHRDQSGYVALELLHLFH